jgi:hypothetical protein
VFVCKKHNVASVLNEIKFLDGNYKVLVRSELLSCHSSLSAEKKSKGKCSPHCPLLCVAWKFHKNPWNLDSLMLCKWLCCFINLSCLWWFLVGDVPADNSWAVVEIVKLLDLSEVISSSIVAVFWFLDSLYQDQPIRFESWNDSFSW